MFQKNLLEKMALFDNDRQLDIPLTLPEYYILPKYLPQRINPLDFVHFKWPPGFPYQRYTVVLEVLDTAGPSYRGMSQLKEDVQIPFVKLGWHAPIALIPDSHNLPRFISTLGRGSTYIVPDSRGQVGDFKMEKIGGRDTPGY